MDSTKEKAKISPDIPIVPKFSKENLNSGNTLVFGKRTFQTMESFWTSKDAFQLYLVVAKPTKNAYKLVLSHSKLKYHLEPYGSLGT
ncbi:hypothetical protein JWG40_02560 [Leptospira sp. 201903074]|uniref:hypothetical protein n=1 Tax=Leptospira abararensis TaxID=2810036 RepID=UPI001965CECB|nr:hypothetical protein [Leptospira abararensis]MBM9545883.1 hypothetical protein [Leptospira abararensis]